MLAFLLQGGGINVGSGGVANLDWCQVYENVASYVRSHYEPSQNLHPSPRWNVTRVLMFGSMVGDSASMARQH